MTNTAPSTPAQTRHPYIPVRVTGGGLVYVSEQLGIADGRVLDGGIAYERRQALTNPRNRLTSAGVEPRHLVKRDRAGRAAGGSSPRSSPGTTRGGR